MSSACIRRIRLASSGDTRGRAPAAEQRKAQRPLGPGCGEDALEEGAAPAGGDTEHPRAPVSEGRGRSEGRPEQHGEPPGDARGRLQPGRDDLGWSSEATKALSDARQWGGGWTTGFSARAFVK